jgi:hypothetical protein
LSTALDLASYCYHSLITQLLKFDCPDSDDKEDHLHAQMFLMMRQQNFGLYLCNGEKWHMGIIVPEIPVTRGDLSQPIDKITVGSEWHRFER